MDKLMFDGDDDKAGVGDGANNDLPDILMFRPWSQLTGLIRSRSDSMRGTRSLPLKSDPIPLLIDGNDQIESSSMT